ncbi:HAD family hydrolase [Paenibacillus piri]|uniref:HAD family hydrolase n=1 Tax=Paenibacillus piri TaxID=2547395 RepID=A0A4R5KAH5_9BACL|nr:HAD family hydrolase [Paenibacillus piri]TDF91862.1 HAD family hydrolase [Paenibacillus piri]
MLNKIEAVIFDLGGTLINYEGFSYYWGDYYEQAFQHVSAALDLNVSSEQLNAAIETLKLYNTRLYPREVEYTPAHIFSDVFKGWKFQDISLDAAIRAFFQFFQRSVIVYPETVEVIDDLKRNGYRIGILTDVPTGMPTELIIQDIQSFKHHIDYFLSSVDCGFRKPNKKGIEMISERFGVEMDRIVFVGDEEKDIQAAQNAGAASVLINREHHNKCYGELIQIADLIEFRELLMKHRLGQGHQAACPD